MRRESFANKQNNGEGLLYDPVLEVQDTEAGKSEETKQREQLVAPLHAGDLQASDLHCQRKNRLSIIPIVGTVRRCPARSC